MTPAPHTTDADCAPFLPADDGTEEQVCTACGVAHGDPCLDCGGRGFHTDACPQVQPPTPFAILDATAWDATFRCPHCGDTCTVSLHTDEELDDRDACCTGPLTDEQEQELIEAIRHERDFNGWAYI